MDIASAHLPIAEQNAVRKAVPILAHSPDGQNAAETAPNIRTIPHQGYRFIAPVRIKENNGCKGNGTANMGWS